MAAHFNPAAIRFLKSLKKNNDRDWFNERKSVYESELNAPWLAVIEAVNHALADFAPDCVKPAQKAMFRIYRDTRFSNDKRPYKTHLGAWWSPSSLPKTSGAGFYAHVAGDAVHVAAGVFMPQPEQLLLIRRHLQVHGEQMRAILADRRLRALMPQVRTNALTRMPKGFPADDPMADLLLGREWGVSGDFPAALATTPQLVSTLTRCFRAGAPLIALLNAPLHAKTPRKSLF